MIPPLQMSDNWEKSFLNVLSNTMSQKENGNAMDMLEDEKKKQMDDMLGGGRNPKIQCRLQSGTVLSQDVGFQIIMKIKKLTVEQKKKDEEERETTFVQTHRLNCMQANLLPLSLCLSRH